MVATPAPAKRRNELDWNGNRYRVSFRHDHSRNWVDHAKHRVEFVRSTIGPTGKQVPWHGPAVLICVDCSARFHTAFKLSHLNHRERQMTSQCTIFMWNGEAWYPLASGTAIVNQKAGDTLNRKEGRLLSFRRALKALENHELSEEICRVYLERLGVVNGPPMRWKNA